MKAIVLDLYKFEHRVKEAAEAVKERLLKAGWSVQEVDGSWIIRIARA